MRAVAVRVILELISYPATIETFEQEIAVLEPGAAATLSFTGLSAAPGNLYEVLVSLGGEDDNPSNDKISFTFLRNTDA